MDLNIRKVDQKAVRKLKVEAASKGMTLRDLCLLKLGIALAGDIAPKDILDQAIERAPSGAIGVALCTESGVVIEQRAIPQKPASYYVPAKYRK